MKRLLVLLFLTLFYLGCAGPAQRSEFWQHSSMYGSWSHLGYSWTGYKKCDPKNVDKSKQQKWWGETVTCP